MTTAILYSRFSTSSQADGDSIRRQNEKAVRFCAYHNLELSNKRFTDYGISGWKRVKRAGLDELLEAIKQGLIPTDAWILVEATDRLSRRGFTHVLNTVSEIVATGCTFCTIDNNQVYNSTNINQLSSALPLILSADLAKSESDRKSDLVRNAKSQIRERREISGKQPFWITAVKKQATLNEHASTARMIVDLRLKGWSPQRICRELNQQQIASPSGKSWSSTSMRRIIESKILYGTKEFCVLRDGVLSVVDVVDGLYPPICSYGEWLQMQSDKTVETRGRVPLRPFAKLLKCGCCGSAMNTRTGKKVVKGGITNYKYKQCIANTNGGCSASGTFKYVEEILTAQLKRLTYIQSGQASPKPKGNIDTLTARLASLNATREFMSDNPQAMAMIYSDIIKVQALIDEEKRSEAIVVDDIHIGQIIEIEDVEERNAQLRKVIDTIELTKLNNTNAKFVINFKNKFKISFIVIYSRNDWKVVLKSDGEVLVPEDTREEWEMDDE